MKAAIKVSSIILFLFVTAFAFGQEKPFQSEVDALTEKIENQGWLPGGLVFTGSSSIRFWMNLQETFPEQNIINTGFGGSQASDLLAHLPILVLKYVPSKVFIYEGDNDLWAKKEVSTIMKELDEIVTWIKRENKNTEVYLVSAKPSPARWEIKESYVILNRLMEEYAQANDGVQFVDVWRAMLDDNGEPKGDIFIMDRLHMNPKGYEIWAEIFRPYVVD
ncbi:GDSL-type esterase/lipase family protein [Algoriphagus namhaensis]